MFVLQLLLTKVKGNHLCELAYIFHNQSSRIVSYMLQSQELPREMVLKFCLLMKMVIASTLL